MSLKKKKKSKWNLTPCTRSIIYLLWPNESYSRYARLVKQQCDPSHQRDKEYKITWSYQEIQKKQLTKSNPYSWYKLSVSWNGGDLLNFLCAWSLSQVWLFATPWTVACQAPLSTGILQARVLEWVAVPSSLKNILKRNPTGNIMQQGRIFCILLQVMTISGNPASQVMSLKLKCLSLAHRKYPDQAHLWMTTRRTQLTPPLQGLMGNRKTLTLVPPLLV